MIKIYKVKSENKEDFVDINTLLATLEESGLQYSSEDFIEEVKKVAKSPKKVAKSKAIPEGHFRTEDGVDLPYGTIVQWYRISTKIIESPYNYTEAHDVDDIIKNNYKVFSTIEAAEKYQREHA